MIITAQNIEQIDARLIKIGVAYADIRAELTDHVATALEAQEGNFNEAFEAYMVQNKKQLKRMNRKMFFTSFKTSHVQIVKTIVQPIFLVAFVVVFSLAYLLSIIINLKVLTGAMFFIFCVIGAVTSILSLVRTFSGKYNYSGTLGYGVTTLVLLYSGIYMLGWQHSLNSSLPVLLFYTVTIVASAAMFVTTQKQYKKYRLQYEK
ncbi:hypothetical protein [Flavobacterium litorale]|uniref:DUF1700 domain-containing protein n=1 Tax=Flavobacterium litorale TaxID=2856519 RepID=A0ABX8V899_9FLAO|nr:hypothetical protein [Flavobacterium litorale]QYJ69079.1 hypothetical protein K1I41_04105 [Flavobacterium litorale]